MIRLLQIAPFLSVTIGLGGLLLFGIPTPLIVSAQGTVPGPVVTLSSLAIQGKTVTLNWTGFDTDLEQTEASEGRISLTRLYQGLCNTSQTYTGTNNAGQELINVPFSRAGWRNLGESLTVTSFANSISHPGYTPDCFLAFFRYGQSDGTTLLSEPILFRVDWQVPSLAPTDSQGRSPLAQLKAKTPGGGAMILMLTPIMFFGIMFAVLKNQYPQRAIYIGLGAAMAGLGGAVLLLDINYFALLLLLIPPAIGFMFARASR